MQFLFSLFCSKREVATRTRDSPQNGNKDDRSTQLLTWKQACYAFSPQEGNNLEASLSEITCSLLSSNVNANWLLTGIQSSQVQKQGDIQTR